MNTLRTPEQQKEINERYDFMMESVGKLGTIALRMIADKTVVKLKPKPDNTVVTNVDITLNEEFIEQVCEYDVGDLVWGEEKSNSQKGNKQSAEQSWMWLIDPIDGTKGFWRSYNSDSFKDNASSIMVTGFAPGEKTPTISVIHNPFQEQQVTISADAFRTYYQSSDMSERKRVRIPQWHGPRNLDSVSTYEKTSWQSAWPDLSYINEVIPMARKVNHQLFMGSVALGDVDLSVFPGPSNPHDVAPGALIVHNAGGVVATFEGTPYERVDWRMYPIAGTIGAANQELVDDVVATYKTLDVTA